MDSFNTDSSRSGATVSVQDTPAVSHSASISSSILAPRLSMDSAFIRSDGLSYKRTVVDASQESSSSGVYEVTSISEAAGSAE